MIVIAKSDFVFTQNVNCYEINECDSNSAVLLNKLKSRTWHCKCRDNTIVVIGVAVLRAGWKKRFGK